MSLLSQPLDVIPPEAARVARAAFPHSTRFMQMRDCLGTVYAHLAFEALSPQRGKPAEAPWRLALIPVMQCAEHLSDRAAANAVRRRIDWQYALRLDLPAPGFPYAILAKFRKRVVAGQAEQGLRDALLARFQKQGGLKAGGRAHTDSTHGLAAVQACNRLACVGEPLRAALNERAVVAPDWLRQQSTADWCERYSQRCAASRFPQGAATRSAYAAQLGREGFPGLHALSYPTAPRWLHDMPIVAILRQTWGYHYYTDEPGHLRWPACAWTRPMTPTRLMGINGASPGPGTKGP
jgi:transposase